jgi:hypothetical protein
VPVVLAAVALVGFPVGPLVVVFAMVALRVAARPGSAFSYRGVMADGSPEPNARRATSFGAQAAAYAAERPGYPDAAIRWALEAVRDRTSPRVLELAADGS